MRGPTITDLLIKQPSAQKYCVLAAPTRPSFVPLRYPLLDERAQGRPGARRHPWALARKSRARARRPQVMAENTPAFPARWFTAYFVLSSVNQCLFATVASCKPLEPA